MTVATVKETTSWIILLRGVTPTGKNKVPMAALRIALEEAGLRDVRTYIQSGNVVASSPLDRMALESLVHDVIAERFGGDIVVLARTPAYFAQALARNPFAGADPARLYFTLLASPPEPGLLQAFLAPGYAPDKIAIVDDMAYIECATKFSDMKLNNNLIERRLKLSATTRVYNTIAALIALTAERG